MVFGVFANQPTEHSEGVAVAVGVTGRWQVKGDMQQVTHDMWHMSADKWQMIFLWGIFVVKIVFKICCVTDIPAGPDHKDRGSAMGWN